MNRRQLIANVLFSLGALCVGGLAWAQSTPSAATVDVAGYKFPASMKIDGQELDLNGAGIRKKAFFKVYAMGLYLPHKTKSAEEAMQMPGHKRIMLYMLRELPMSEFTKLMIKGIEKNASREEFVKLVPDIARLGQLFSEYPEAQTGDLLTMDWIPGTGMVATYRGKVQGAPFTEPVLFKTILKIWLGDDPPSSSLKNALLGNS